MGSPSREVSFRPNRENEQLENDTEPTHNHLPSARERLDQVFNDQEGPSTAELREAVTTIVGIRPSTFRAYLVLLEHPGSTISEIATEMETGYSNVHRRLARLREEGLVSRHPDISSGGSQRYQYQAQSLAETGRWLRREIDQWENAVNEQVEALQTASTA